MNLYIIHDNIPGLGLLPEETTAEAVWSDDEDTAAGLYAKRYKRYKWNNGEQIDRDGMVVELRPTPDGVTPVKPEPHIETRPEVLRRLGWGMEGETSCNTCGLCPMELPQFRICEGCDNCFECVGQPCERCGHCPDCCQEPHECHRKEPH